MDKVYQTLFGGPDGDSDKMGNCFPACIASIIGAKLEDVPHFYQKDYSWWEIHAWLKSHGYRVLPFELPMHEDWAKIFDGCVGVFTGPSPRFDSGVMHAAVGRITKDGWELLHDPHPEGDGFSGPPDMVEILLADHKEPHHEND